MPTIIRKAVPRADPTASYSGVLDVRYRDHDSSGRCDGKKEGEEGNGMTEKMTQDQRLDYLVEEFKKDSVQYKDLETPKDTEGKRYVLRSPMNIRMPKPFPEEALAKVKQGKSKGKTIIVIGQ